MDQVSEVCLTYVNRSRLSKPTLIKAGAQYFLASITTVGLRDRSRIPHSNIRRLSVVSCVAQKHDSKQCTMQCAQICFLACNCFFSRFISFRIIAKYLHLINISEILKTLLILAQFSVRLMGIEIQLFHNFVQITSMSLVQQPRGSRLPSRQWSVGGCIRKVGASGALLAFQSGCSTLLTHASIRGIDIDLFSCLSVSTGKLPSIVIK